MEPTTPSLQKEESIDIQKFLFKTINKWYWFVISVAICYSVAYTINKYTEPQYSVSASLIINDDRKSTADQMMAYFDRFNPRKSIDNEIAVLKSYKLTRKAIEELDDFEINYYGIGRVRKPFLYKGAPFRVILDTQSVNSRGVPVQITLLNKNEYKVEINEDKKTEKVWKFGEPYTINGFHFTLFLKEPEKFNSLANYKYYFVINDLNSLVNTYKGKLSIATNDKKGTILTLSTVGFSPEMESDYINKLMDMYIKTGLAEKNQTAINTINFIDSQLETVVDSLHRAEDKLQTFREKNKILDISTEGSTIMSKLSEVQSEKVKLDMQIRYYQYLQEYIDKKKDFREVVAPSVMGIGDPLLNQLVTQISTAMAERADISLNVQQNYPGLTRIDAKIQNAIDALKENIKQIINSAELSSSQVDKRLAQIEEEIQKLPITERRLLTIQRDFKLNDQIYNFLLQRRAEAAISKASNVADNKVLDAASSINCTQISPKPGRNTTMALVLGFLIPLAIILMLEFFNNKITEPKDVENATRIPVIGTIGHNEQMSELPVSDNPQSPISESFRGLRTNLQYVIRKKETKIICISSTISGEGKTFSAVNLAAIIAQSNRKTLLMSLDLRKPQIHKIFNFSNDVGLSTFLIGRSNYADSILQTNINNLYIATSGPVPPNPAELLETKRMDEFIAAASEEFDTIIMDTPPVAIVTDAVILSRFCDAFLYVIRQNYSNKSVLSFVEELHEKHGISNLGILINDVKIPNYYGYRYAYGYGYGYSYKSYYGESKQKKSRFRVFRGA